MSYSMVGYQTGFFKFSVTAAHRGISVSDIQIKPADIILKAAVVTASMPPVTVTEDTVAYNADAYHAPEGSMLEDLISLIPGVETADNGQIKINGKVYDKILVDGKEFFGNDPQMALKNLPANIVKKIKTYDRKSDLARLTGIDDGVENDVLDIEIKPNMLKGLVGQASGATGNHDRYSSSLNVNKFRSDYHLSVMGGMNNVNNPGFSERGKGAVNFSQAKRPGLTASKGVGISYAKDKKDKYRMSGNARYNFSNAENESNRHSETVYNDSSYRYNDKESHSLRWHDEFNMNFNLEWTPDSMTSIQLRPNFSYSKTNNWSTDSSESEKWDGNPENDSVRINQRQARSTSSQEGSDEDVTFSILRRLSRTGRSISLHTSYNYGSYTSTNFSRSIMNYYLEPERNRNYSRFTDGNNFNMGYSLGLSYNEPLYKGGYLQLHYAFSYRHGRVNRYGHEVDYTDMDSLINNKDEADWNTVPVDTLLSSCYENTYITNSINLNMRHVTKKVNISYGVNLNPRHNETKYIFGPKMYKGLITQDLINWAPNLAFKYRFSKRTTLDLSYHGNSNEPNIENLQEVIDNTDPQNVRYGNPALKPSFTNNFKMNYNFYGEKSHRSLVTNLTYTTVNNSTSKMSLYESSTGVKVSKLMNVNGYHDLNGNVNFNTPLDTLDRFTLSTESSVDYNQSTNYNSTPLTNSDLLNAGVTVDFQDIQPQDIDKLVPLALKNETRTLRLHQTMTLRYRLTDYLFRLGGGINYYKVENSIQIAKQKETFDYNLKGEAQLDLPLGLQVSTNLDFVSRHGYSTKIQKNIAMWNAEVNERFLKHNAGLLRFQIFDILHQRSNISRDISNLTITDTRSQVLRNYFLVAFQYRLNTMGHLKKAEKELDKESSKKDKDEDGNNKVLKKKKSSKHHH